MNSVSRSYLSWPKQICLSRPAGLRWFQSKSTLFESKSTRGQVQVRVHLSTTLNLHLGAWVGEGSQWVIILGTLEQSQRMLPSHPPQFGTPEAFFSGSPSCAGSGAPLFMLILFVFFLSSPYSFIFSFFFPSFLSSFSLSLSFFFCFVTSLVTGGKRPPKPTPRLICPTNYQPEIFLENGSSHAYILISFTYVSTSFIFCTLRSVIWIHFCLSADCARPNAICIKRGKIHALR